MKYAGENIGLWINVGTAKNDGKNHIYTLSNKAEEAPTEYGVSRPVGNAIQSASSLTSISESAKKINTFDKKIPVRQIFQKNTSAPRSLQSQTFPNILRSRTPQNAPWSARSSKDGQTA